MTNLSLIDAISVTVNPYNQNLLSANINISSTVSLKFSYIVNGKTSDVDFTYSSEVFTTNPIIPVIGLYANTINEIDVVVEDISGNQETTTVYADTTGQDYGDVALNINIEILDETIAETSINNGWLMTSYFNGYDKNGDIRITGLYQWGTTPLKTHNGLIIAGDNIFGYYYATTLYAINLLGKINKTINAPDGFGFHHDVTWGSTGNIFVLATMLEDQTDSNKLESIVTKIDENTGEKIWSVDYSEQFYNSDVLANSDTNDVHINTIDYIEKLDQIIINSRSTCTIFAISPDNGEIIWMIDNPANEVLDESKNLTAINDFIYPNGEHAVFFTNNVKYNNYAGDNQLVLSIFNNNSCLNDDGSDNVRKMESSKDDDYYAAPVDSQAVILGIDLTTRTAERLDTFTVTGERSELRGSVFQNGDNYDVFFCDAYDFFTLDTNNTIGVRALDIETVTSYRARIFSYDELRSLI